MQLQFSILIHLEILSLFTQNRLFMKASFFQKYFHPFSLIILILFISNLIWQITSITDASITVSTNATVSKILNIEFGSTNDIYYESVIDADLINRIRRYQIIDGIKYLLATFTPFQQQVGQTKILEIKSKYLLVHSLNSTTVEVFYLNGTNKMRKTFSEHITRFFYSNTRSKLILLKQFGEITIIPLTDFFSNIYTNQITFYNSTQLMDGQISYNEQYLAVGTYSAGMFFVLDIDSGNLIYSYTFVFTDTTKLTWNTNNNIIYLFDKSTGNLSYIDIANQNITNQKNLFPTYTVTIWQMKYLDLTNQLLFIVTTANVANKMRFWAFSVVDGTLPYFKGYLRAYSWGGVALSHSSLFGNLSFFVWGNPQVTEEYGVVKISSNYTVPVNASFFADLTLSYADDPVNTTNLTANSTENLTINSTTNLTANFTANLTANSSLFNQSINNQTQNQANFSNETMLIAVASYQQILQNTLNNTALLAINKAPGSRMLFKPVFMFFSNFDDLWLYVYHKRQYDEVISKTFSYIRDMENQKWKVFSFETIYQDLLNFNITELKDVLNSYKKDYTSNKFVEIEGCANGYILNTLNFYTINLVVLLGVFIVGKIVFIILNRFNFWIRIFFTRYSFWFYLVILCLEGNIQYMSYLFGFDIKTMASKQFISRIITLSVILYYFFFVFIIISIYYIVRYSYKNQAQSMYQNCKQTPNGIFYLTLQLGVRNLLLGTIHIFLEDQYDSKIASLILVQTAFLVFNIFHVRLTSNRCFIKKSKQWINIYAIFCRILIISTFLIQKNLQIVSQNAYAHSNLSEYYALILQTYMFMWILSILIEFTNIFFELKKIFQESKLIQRALNTIFSNETRLKTLQRIRSKATDSFLQKTMMEDNVQQIRFTKQKSKIRVKLKHFGLFYINNQGDIEKQNIDMEEIRESNGNKQNVSLNKSKEEIERQMDKKKQIRNNLSNKNKRRIKLKKTVTMVNPMQILEEKQEQGYISDSK